MSGGRKGGELLSGAEPGREWGMGTERLGAVSLQWLDNRRRQKRPVCTWIQI